MKKLCLVLFALTIMLSILIGCNDAPKQPEDTDNPSSDEQLLPNKELLQDVNYVFDTLPGASVEKAVVIKLWEHESATQVAQITLTSDQNAKQVNEIERRWLAVVNAPFRQASEDQVFLTSAYRAEVYFYGFTPSKIGSMQGFRYMPDYDIDLWAFANGNDALYPLFFGGISELTMYVNEIMEKRMDTDFSNLQK